MAVKKIQNKPGDIEIIREGGMFSRTRWCVWQTDTQGTQFDNHAEARVYSALVKICDKLGIDPRPVYTESKW